MEEKPDRFAYGLNEIDGCNCPLVEMGIEPQTRIDAEIVASIFDDEIFALSGTGSYKGTVRYEVAKDAWNRVIDHIKAGGDDELLPIANEVKEEIFS